MVKEFQITGNLGWIFVHTTSDLRKYFYNKCTYLTMGDLEIVDFKTFACFKVVGKFHEI